MILSRLTLEAPVVSFAGFALDNGPVVSIGARKHRILIADIQQAVVTYFGLCMGDMKSGRRAREVARPRQVAMYLCRHYTLRSLPEIGRHFGDRDHTTVMWAIARVKQLIEVDEDFANDVRYLCRAVEMSR